MGDDSEVEKKVSGVLREKTLEGEAEERNDETDCSIACFVLMTMLKNGKGSLPAFG